jgi:hypothetical protein
MINVLLFLADMSLLIYLPRAALVGLWRNVRV